MDCFGVFCIFRSDEWWGFLISGAGFCFGLLVMLRDFGGDDGFLFMM